MSLVQSVSLSHWYSPHLYVIGTVSIFISLVQSVPLSGTVGSFMLLVQLVTYHWCSQYLYVTGTVSTFVSLVQLIHLYHWYSLYGSLWVSGDTAR